MNKVHPHDLGFAFGLFMAFFHGVWSLMVALGLAQKFMDFIFDLHMIRPAYHVNPFDLVKMIGLMAITGVIGYIMGWVLGYIWNRYAVK